MANTHKLIASNTTGSSTSTITFSSIPQTYTDLKIIIKAKVDGSGSNMAMRFNGSTGTYYQMVLSTDGSGSGPAFSSSLSSIAYWYTSTNDAAYNGPRFTTNEISINHYTGSNYKSCLIYSNQTGLAANYCGKAQTQVQWGSTDAITSISIFNYGGSNFIAGCTFDLYGIKRN